MASGHRLAGTKSLLTPAGEISKTKFYSPHKLCYISCTSIHILIPKGGGVLMATKKAAAKKPVKKAAKKK